MKKRRIWQAMIICVLCLLICIQIENRTTEVLAAEEVVLPIAEDNQETETQTIYLNNAEELLEAQNRCEERYGYNGWTLIISSATGENAGIWDLTELEGFVGFGTEATPFQGTIKCHYAVGSGVKIKLNKPIIAHMGDGARVEQLDIICDGCSAAIAGNISGNVTIDNIRIEGSISNTDGNAGAIVASVKAGSTVSLSNASMSGTVTGRIAGGLAGSVEDNVVFKIADNVAMGTEAAPITVTGSEAAGGYFGFVTGSSTWDLSDCGKIVTTVVGTDGSYAGGYAGKLSPAGDAATLQIINGNSVTVNVSGTGNSGGLIGLCENNTQIVIPEGNFTISGTVTGSNGNCGGVVGELRNPQMVLKNYQVNAAVSGKIAGGIVGRVQGGKGIIGDVTIQSQVAGSVAAGGLVGEMASASALELQGTLSVANAPVWEGTKGLLVGKQDSCLVYLSEIEGKLADVNQLQLPTDTGLEEIGTYGGVCRNQQVSTGKLIGDGTIGNVGVINHTVTLADTGYQMNSVADFQSLAIMLGTDGNFAASAFPGKSYTELLAASYLVNSSVDISYDKTGIVSLNRNDVEDAAHAFSGKFKGNSADITITQNINVKQARVGLFSTLGGNAEFSDLVINGTVENAIGTGGIAYQTLGSGLTLSNITMGKTFVNNQDCIGGVIAKEINKNGSFSLTADKITLASVIDAGAENSNYSGFITELENADININTVMLGGGLNSTATGVAPGGFMGKKWLSVRGQVTDINVPDTATYSVQSVFGGLWYQITNSSGYYLKLQNIKLDKLIVNASSSQSHCALLIQDARSLVVEITDYDSIGCVVNNPGPYFDEIAGRSKEDFSSMSSTGIISLHSSTDNFPVYHYENKVESLKNITNPGTMYFYDVFQHLDKADGSKVLIGTDLKLDSVDKMLLWDVVHYANTGNISSVFNQYFVGGSIPSLDAENYTFVGNLDLSQISFYPVIRAKGTYKGESAVITFGAKAGFVDMGEWQLSNENANSQHYGLQAGLFYQPGAINVSDLTLSGKIANLQEKSGGLICGEQGINENCNFSNVTLQNLWIADYEDGQAGLLISSIPANNAGIVTVNFNGINMTGYSENSTEKAAAALIGSAGGASVTNLILNFSQMVIADDKDERTDAVHNGKVLKYASFLYNYNYTNNAEKNKGHGLYLFSESDDSAGKVTYGAELDVDTEFSDSDKLVFEESDPVPSEVYKPYVYQVKNIEVNPKSGDILKGCGTYEDPYIIETEKQFLTLYRYMNETGTEGNYQYQAFYQGWKVIMAGDDSTFCTTKHNVTWSSETGSFSGDGAEAARTFGQEDFPTPDDMSRAYYRLGNNIDLSKSMSTTYKQIADDFVGFGTQTRPFVGVWYGKGSDRTIYSVTLPDKTGEQKYSAYGFIQYAKGAVVKDIEIKTSKAGEGTAIDPTITVTINEMGGGVIACILGGDNIIDNVKVTVDFTLTLQGVSLGGYVGELKKGGLILRNVSDNSLKNFRLNDTRGETVGKEKKDISKLGAVVGKVEDGYVVYEGDSDPNSFFWEEKGGNTTLEQMNYYQVLYIDKLQENASKMQIAKVDNQITFTIPNADALQVLSMAMNADAFNVMPSTDANYVGGYTENARCRKATYGDIGCDTATDDYIKAASYDNVMDYNAGANLAYAYPYLYQYMGIEGHEYLNYLDAGYSILNPGSKINDTAYHIQWNLVENTEYYMSQFEQAFRGIGALYQTGNGYGGTFRGSFDGKNSLIHLDMERNIYYGHNKPSVDAQNNASYHNVGLFNSFKLDSTVAEDLYVESGDFKNPFATKSTIWKVFVIKNIQISGQIQAKAEMGVGCAGGVVGSIESGRYVFDNIKSTSLKIFSDSTSLGFYEIGGVIGYVHNGGYLLVQNCNFVGSKNSIQLKGARHSAGGLVGTSRAACIKIASSQIEYLDISSEYGYSGGLLGSQAVSGTTVIVDGTEMKKCGVYNSNIEGGTCAGGIIGFCYTSYLYLKGIECSTSTLSSAKEVGGIIANVNSLWGVRISEGIVKDVLLNQTETKLSKTPNACLGGVFGYLKGASQRNVEIENIKVYGTAEEDYSCKIVSGLDKADEKHCGIGGIVGYSEQGTLILRNCMVEKLAIEIPEPISIQVNNSLSAGGLVGYTSLKLQMTGSTHAQNLYVKAPLGKEVSIDSVGAGGYIGIVAENGTIEVKEDDTSFVGLSATNNIVTGKYAGGMIGISNGATKVALRGITLSRGQVTSDKAAGGMFGLVNPGMDGVSIYAGENQINNLLISGANAGGIIGEAAMNGPLNLEHITVSNNTIVGKQTKAGEAYSAGGLVGKSYATSTSAEATFYDLTVSNNAIYCEVQGTSLTADEIDKFAVGGAFGYIGKSEAAADAKGDIKIDNVQIDTSNQIGVKKANAAGVTQIITKNGETYQLADVTLSTAGSETAKDYDALLQVTEKYGYFVGSVVGVVDTDNVQLYMLKTEDTDNPFVTAVMQNNPPVADVGRFTQTSADDYRKYCHIIYGAPTEQAKNAQSNLAHMKAEVYKLDVDYVGGNSADLLAKYRLKPEEVELFNKSYQTSYVFPGTDKKIDFPILVYKAENGNLQEVLEQFTNIMTNAAGASASDIDGKYLKIDCNPKICNGNLITDGVAGTESIIANIQNGQVIYQSNRYDGLKEDGLSFTEMIFEYGWEGHKKTFVLNVFSEEPILYSVHTKIMEGRITEVDTIRQRGISESKNSIIMANDSDYTMLLEYTFGKARKNMPDSVSVDKVFYLQAANALKPLPKGTRLLLVDVLNGNKAYYYTVNEDNLTQVKFTDFKDSQGNNYVNKDINKIPDIVGAGETYTDLDGDELTEVGVERYLLTVLNADKTDSVYYIHSGLQFSDENFASRFMLEENHKEEVEIPVIAVPGLEISLDKTNEKTDVSGEISKEGTVTVKATMKLEAADIYWAEKGKLGDSGVMIDSSNNGKYLELAFYLRDGNENRVRLPAGTNFSYKLSDGSYSDKTVIADDSLIYYYKDIRNQYNKPDSEYLISGITGNTYVPVEFQLDFSGADLSNITEESYYAWIDLLRTANRDYPMGNGNKLDSHSETVNANASQEFGFAVKADDLSTLAINTYPTADTNEIPYHVMFDFSEILKTTSGAGKEMVLEKWAGYEYEITYQLYQKDKNGVYQKYTGEDIEILVEDNLSVNGAVTSVYTFSKEDIETGNGEEAVEGVLSFAGNLKLNTSKLALEKKNLTNYKLQATLTVREKEQDDPNQSQVQTTNDFFIFTITKLKTDL